MSQTTAQQQTPAAADAAQFTASRRNLVEAINLAALAVSARPTAPTQAGVLLESAPGSVTLHAHDFDTTVSVTLPAVQTRTGRTVVGHAELKRVVAALAAGEPKSAADRMPVTLASHIVSVPDVAVPLTTLPAAEFPELSTPVFAQITVDAEALLGQLARVVPAAGTDETLSALTCVRLDLEGDALTLAATDRYRLALAALACQRVGSHGSFSAHVPAFTLGKMAQHMRRYTGSVGIGVTTAPWGALITFTFGDTKISIRSWEGGALPPADSLMPLAAHLSFTLARETMVKAAQKAVALAKAKSGKDAFCLIDGVAPGTVSVAPYFGEADRDAVRGITVPATLTAGAPEAFAASSVVFNARFLLDALGAFSGDGITVHQAAAGSDGRVCKPVLLTDGPELAGEGYRHLIMPIRPSD
ncbi:DNA polymerase III subunit beta [Streptomyces sp. NPDC004031]